MLQFYFIIASLLSINISIAQCIISGEVINHSTGDNAINIRRPIDGYFNDVSFDTADNVPIRNGKFSVKINCFRPVFITISNSGTYIKLIVTPNDSIHVNFDFSNYNKAKKVECTFSGSNAKGHEFFYEYNYEPTIKYETIWKILKTSDKHGFVPAIKSEVEKQIRPFTILFTEGNIDSGYYQLMKFTIASLLSSEATRKLGNYNLTNVYIKDRKERAEVVNKIFGLYFPLDSNLYYGMFSDHYARNYFLFQRTLRLNTDGIDTQPDTVITHNNIVYKVDGTFASLYTIPDQKLREYLIGSLTLKAISMGVGEHIKEAIAFFKVSHPQSEYTSVITSYSTKMEEKKQNERSYPAYFAPSFIKILDALGKIRNFSFTANDSLKNKLFFVDLWATWCGPCLQEMQYNYKIDSFLYANNINRLYVSIDKPIEKGKWETVINNMHLGGYHILAGPEMNRFLSEEFGLSEGLIAIPRYLIIQNGKILVKDAYRPSDFEKLKEQIEKILAKDSKK